MLKTFTSKSGKHGVLAIYGHILTCHLCFVPRLQSFSNGRQTVFLNPATSHCPRLSLLNSGALVITGLPMSGET